MGFGGDPLLWADLFPDYLIPEILDLVVDSWKTFPMPKSIEHEVPITGRFCAHLRRQKRPEVHLFNIQPESDELAPGTGDLLGRIDLRLIHGYREEVYFALECKRLNVGKPSSLAGKYVDEGMTRFVTGKYAGGLDKGGMLGYVMDGRLDDAIEAVRKAIESRRDKLKMDGSATLAPSSLRPKSKQVKETQHLQNGKPFTVHHVFVPVV
jgi:hypothetical protein